MDKRAKRPTRRTLFATLVLATVAQFPFQSAAQADPSISIRAPWARATPHGATTAAVYLTLENRSAVSDRLLSLHSPIASSVQVHEMSMAGGVMQMRPVAGGLAVPAHGSVTLSPGGYHIMMVGLTRALNAGDTETLSLTFQKAGRVDVSVPVLPIGASAPKAAGATAPSTTPKGMQPNSGGAMRGMKMN